MKSNKQKIIIVDLDGTLTDCNHRVHHVEKVRKDYDSFFEAMGLDKLNLWCESLILGMKAMGVETVLLTGRSDKYRDITLEWLARNNIPYKKLFMRSALDDREDHEIKREIFLDLIEPDYETMFVVEDRLSVVKMWRKLSITCLQCDWGDF